MSYYSDLELSQSATQDEIKQSYRRLAMRWHPDRNNNSKLSEEKFKSIKAAYEALTRPDYAHVAPYQSPPNQSPKVYSPPNVNVVKGDPDSSTTITLSQVLTGAFVKVSKKTLCPVCGGSGKKELFPTGSIGELVWRNKGVVSYHRAETKEEQQSDACRFCKGTGEVIEFDCYFEIPAGVVSGMVLRLSRKDLRKYSIGGSKNIKIIVAPDPVYFRKNDDLYRHIYVDHKKLIDGGFETFRTMNGRELEVTIPKGSINGSQLRLSKYGLPDLQTNELGDLYLILVDKK
jgi:molecular chaperone DnaJ